MKGYLIKVTYIEGQHAGESYLLGKGTYVIDGSLPWTDKCYKTLASAKRVCSAWYADNELCKRIERQDEKTRIIKGWKPKDFYVYESRTFEPYEVDMIDWRI